MEAEERSPLPSSAGLGEEPVHLNETQAIPGSNAHFNAILAEGQYEFFAKRRFLRLWLGIALDNSARRRASQAVVVGRLQRLLKGVLRAWKARAAESSRRKSLGRQIEIKMVARRFFDEWRALLERKRGLLKAVTLLEEMTRRRQLRSAFGRWSLFSSEAARSEALSTIAEEKGVAIRKRFALKMLKRNARIRAGLRDLAVRASQRSRVDLLRLAFNSMAGFATMQREERNSLYLADAHATSLRLRRAFKGFIAGTDALARDKLLHPATRKALQVWRDVTTICKRQRVKDLLAVSHSRRSLMLKCWQALRDNVAAAKDERKNELLAVTFRTMALQQGTLSYWHSVTTYRRERKAKEEKAGFFWAQRLMKKALAAWRLRHEEKKKSTQARMHRMAGVLRAVMRAWHDWSKAKASTSVDFVRRRYLLLDRRALMAIKKWRALTPLLKAERKQLALVEQTARRNALERTFLLWRTNAEEAVAERTNEGKALRFWRRTALRLGLKALKTGTALQSHLQAAFETTSRGVARRAKQTALKAWRSEAATSLQRRVATKEKAALFAAHLRRTILRRGLRLWLGNALSAAKEEAQERQARQHYERRALALVFAAWARDWLPERRSKRDKRSLADRFDGLRASSRAFGAWREQHAEVRKEAARFSLALEHRAEVLCKKTFAAWKRWLSHRRLLVAKMFNAQGLDALFPAFSAAPSSSSSFSAFSAFSSSSAAFAASPYAVPASGTDADLDAPAALTPPGAVEVGGGTGDDDDPFSAALARLAETEEMLKAQRLQREREVRRRAIEEKSVATTLAPAVPARSHAVPSHASSNDDDDGGQAGTRRQHQRPRPRAWAASAPPPPPQGDGRGAAANPVTAAAASVASTGGVDSRSSSRPRPLRGEEAPPSPLSAAAQLSPAPTVAHPIAASVQAPTGLSLSLSFPSPSASRRQPPQAQAPVPAALFAQEQQQQQPSTSALPFGLAFMSATEVMDAEAILSYWDQEHASAASRVEAILALRQRVEALIQLQAIRGSSFNTSSSSSSAHEAQHDHQQLELTAALLEAGEEREREEQEDGDVDDADVLLHLSAYSFASTASPVPAPAPVPASASALASGALICEDEGDGEAVSPSPSSPDAEAAGAEPDLHSLLTGLQASLEDLERTQADYEHKWALAQKRANELAERLQQHRETVASIVRRERHQEDRARGGNLTSRTTARLFVGAAMVAASAALGH